MKTRSIFVTSGLMCWLMVCVAQGQTFKVIHEFNRANGAYPQANLIQDSNGNLYGTASYGGVTNYYGDVFLLAPSGKETVLHSFAGSDGAVPYFGSLIRDAGGNMYGTTSSGGDLMCQASGSKGCGAVFKLAPDGKETVLYSFVGGRGGYVPFRGLLLDAKGILYGTTSVGGTYDQGGTVFSVDSITGKHTVLYNFNGPPDGQYPEAGLVQDAKGNLYGTTAFGGTVNSNCGNQGCGTVFELKPGGKGGWTESILYSFTGGTDGYAPEQLIRDSAGNLYGTTNIGGGSSCYNGVGCGTVFKLSPGQKGGWIETVLYKFTGFPGKDGAYPYGVLALDSAGNLYGTTAMGGGSAACSPSGVTVGCGTVFKIDPHGKETVLHRFALTDGANPYAGLVRDAKSGALYGVTSSGGGPGQGVAFKLVP